MSTKKVYFAIPEWAVLLDAETHEEVLEAPREYCRKVAEMENWEIVDPPKGDEKGGSKRRK